jgi:hypothetical protein
LAAVPRTHITTTFGMALISTDHGVGWGMILIIPIYVEVKTAWNYKFASPVSPGTCLLLRHVRKFPYHTTFFHVLEG